MRSCVKALIAALWLLPMQLCGQPDTTAIERIGRQYNAVYEIAGNRTVERFIAQAAVVVEATVIDTTHTRLQSGERVQCLHLHVHEWFQGRVQFRGRSHYPDTVWVATLPYEPRPVQTGQPGLLVFRHSLEQARISTSEPLASIPLFPLRFQFLYKVTDSYCAILGFDIWSRGDLLDWLDWCFAQSKVK